MSVRGEVHISVIVPIYNVELYVERCLRSLFTQTKTDGVEFILVNDCTPDDSMSVVERVVAEFPGLDIKIMTNEHNRGLFATRCVGVAAARGEYIQHIDSDDWVEPTMLEELWAERLRTDADIILFDFIFEFRDRSVAKCHAEVAPIAADCIPLILERKIDNSICFKMVRRDLYVAADVKPVEGLNMGEDLLMSINMLLVAQGVSYLKRPFYHYDKSIGSSITSQITPKYTNDILRVEQELERSINNRGAMSDKIANVLMCRKFMLCRLQLSRSESCDHANILAQYPEVLAVLWSFRGAKFKYKLAIWASMRGIGWLQNMLFASVRRRIAKKQMNA